MFTGDA
jgi:hypothetical protein